MSINKYRVLFTAYAQKYFLQDLGRRHPEVWPATRKAIVSQLRHVDMLIGTGRTESPIYLSENRLQKLLHIPFTLAGSSISPAQSGYHLVAHIDDAERLVQILLIYHQSHLPANIPEPTWRHDTLESAYKNIRY